MGDDATAFASYLHDVLKPGVVSCVAPQFVDGKKPYIVAVGAGLSAGTVISRSSLGVIPIPIMMGLVAANGVAAAKLAASSPAWNVFSSYASSLSRPAAHGMITTVRTDETLDVLTAGSLGPAAVIINNSHSVHRWADFAPLVPGRAAPGVITDMRSQGSEGVAKPLPGSVQSGRKILKSRRSKIVSPLVSPVCPVDGSVHAASPFTAALSRVDSLDVLSSLAARRKTDPTAFVQPNVVVAAYMDLPGDGTPSSSWEIVVEVRVLDKDIPAGTALMYAPATSMSSAAQVAAIVKDSISAWALRAEKWVSAAEAQFARQESDAAAAAAAAAGPLVAPEARDNLILSLMMTSYCGPPPAFPRGPDEQYRFPAAHLLVASGMDASAIVNHSMGVGLKWMTSGLSVVLSSMRTPESWHPADFLATILKILLSSDAKTRGMDPSAYAKRVQDVVFATQYAQEEFEKVKGGASRDEEVGISPYSEYVTDELLMPRVAGVGAIVKRFVTASLALMGVQQVTMSDAGTLGVRVMASVGSASDIRKDIPYILLPQNLAVPTDVIKVVADAAVSMMPQ